MFFLEPVLSILGCNTADGVDEDEDISLKTENVSLMVVQDEKSRKQNKNQQAVRDGDYGSRSAPNLMDKHCHPLSDSASRAINVISKNLMVQFVDGSTCH